MRTDAALRELLMPFPLTNGYHEFNRDEESIRLGGYYLFESDIAEIKELPDFAIIRATETWQQAGAYYVRIQSIAMTRAKPFFI